MTRLELLQRRLYRCAKEDKTKIFYSLHDKICRIDILKTAWKMVSSNRGSPGIDGQTIEDIQRNEDVFLGELQRELREKTYNVECVRRVFIPKANGKQRPLGIPTVKDRIVQQAVKLVIEPIFEADFKNSSYAYRPNRSARQASLEVRKYINYGCTNVIDMDIKGFFDSIDHDRLIELVMERVSDPYLIKLIREWLRAGVIYGETKVNPTLGTPQGGVISPLLANIYLNFIDRNWESMRMDNPQTFDAHLIHYADDYVILTSGDTARPMKVITALLSHLKLELNMEKTHIVKADQGFDFLGIHFVRSRTRGRSVTYFFPSRKSMENFRNRVREIIPRSKAHFKTEQAAIKQLNYLITGWTNYFNHTNANRVYGKLQDYLTWKAAKFYCEKHKIRKVSDEEDTRKKFYNLGLKYLKGNITHRVAHQ